MAKTYIWTSIAGALTGEIAEGHYNPGDKLPTEAELAQRFGVNRHTVRRALLDLSQRGLTHSRRGAGVFVAAKPTDYKIGRRVRYSQNLTESGQTAQRDILSLETRAANPREAENLALSPSAPVHVTETLAYSHNAPMALSRHVFPADRFPGLLEALASTRSITAALKQHGVADYTRAHTRMAAKLAGAVQAGHLRIREGDPILRTIGVNVDAQGQPIEYGHTWFAGDRVSLILSSD